MADARPPFLPSIVGPPYLPFQATRVCDRYPSDIPPDRRPAEPRDGKAQRRTPDSSRRLALRRGSQLDARSRVLLRCRSSSHRRGFSGVLPRRVAGTPWPARRWGGRGEAPGLADGRGFCRPIRRGSRDHFSLGAALSRKRSALGYSLRNAARSEPSDSPR